MRVENTILLRTSAALLGAALSCAFAGAQGPSLTINADHAVSKVSPRLYGLMTEEINFSYEGGIYGELIRNRTFKANGQNPVFWSPVGDTSLALDTNQPLNEALNLSLKFDASKASKASSPENILLKD